MERKELFSRISDGYDINEVDAYVDFFQSEYGNVVKITEELFKKTDELSSALSELSESNKKLRRENSELYNDCILLAKSINAQSPEEKKANFKEVRIDEQSNLFDEKINGLYNKYLSDLRSVFTELVDSAVFYADSFISDANEVKTTVLSRIDGTSNDNSNRDLKESSSTKEMPRIQIVPHPSSFQKETVPTTDAAQNLETDKIMDFALEAEPKPEVNFDSEMKSVSEVNAGSELNSEPKTSPSDSKAFADSLKELYYKLIEIAKE